MLSPVIHDMLIHLDIRMYVVEQKQSVIRAGCLSEHSACSIVALPHLVADGHNARETVQNVRDG